ncbi:hypothetical protein AJ80_07029 [Polytolypa hystricis UAMH7299]|uniref:Uncharacterized protein n=1 Tax=Polytolypa hystricis (strain UAMH7299) TaxID=1447883 RepID=A0A2B7XSQ4_POLH7|nr:hypothetical protein AJ80_07029 [Polytolypa hystricis UAMH7299]
MAYNAVSQVDHDVASNGTGSDRSSPRLPDNNHSFRPLSLDFANIGGSGFMEEAKTTTQQSTSHSLKSAIKSLGSTASASYDMVEDDDYKLVDPVDSNNNNNTLNSTTTPAAATASHDQNAGTSPRQPPETSGTRPRTSDRTTSDSPEPLVQTPVSLRPVPLRHPTPDLQSLQGAYVGNVERLERTAERLSMTSDITEELRKMKMEQKRQSSGSTYGTAGVGSTSPRSRGFSTGSVSNSIIGVNTAARANGYSPQGFVSSPRGSLKSATSSQPASRYRSGSTASRLAQVLELENVDQTTPSDQASATAIPPPPEPPSQPYNTQISQPPVDDGDQRYTEEELEERPRTAGSGDTYRQSTALFKDFDGVHFTPHTTEASRSRSISLSKPPLARESRNFDRPRPGENMVYYPAPVPMMLNLPQRLSKKPNAEHEKRRSEVLSAMPMDARKSAVWLPATTEEEPESTARNMKRSSQLPPQLRASAYFDQPSGHLDVQVKENSAVATLDSILDAAAHAPVSAFTDHPIVGHVGSEVYGRSARTKRIAKNKVKKRASAQPLDPHGSAAVPTHSQIRLVADDIDGQTEQQAGGVSGEDTPLRPSYEDPTGKYHRSESVDSDGRDHRRNSHDRGSREDEDEDSSEGEEEEAEEGDDLYVGAPTTLLAELQMRKQEQKLRTRTAANAFPNGMHSTLLELDAVAQHQRKTRNQRHITLAWEDPGAAERFEPDDEDVPLAVLFPSKNPALDENRPMGLMEQLELEENEPLSRRRARMRGERPGPPPRDPSPMKRASMYTLDIPGLPDGGDDDDSNNGEEETLAQRAQRLRNQGESSGADFASELLSQFGGPKADANKSTEQVAEAPEAEPAEEETLGQRRKRLQAEAQSGTAAGTDMGASNTLQRHSMANILQAHPVRYAPPISSSMTNLAPHHRPHSSRTFQHHPAAPYANRLSTTGPTVYPPPANGLGQVAGYPMAMHSTPTVAGIPYNKGMPYSQARYNNSGVGMNNLGHGMGYGPPGGVAGAGQDQGPMIDPRQRDMIDRWRQSVL